MFETRVYDLSRFLFVVILMVFLLAFAGVASAQNVSTNPEGLTFHGFIDATAFLQNQSFTFGNGQIGMAHAAGFNLD